MEMNEGDIWRLLEIYFSTPQSVVHPDELKSLVITLLNQKLELNRQFEDLDSFTKLSANTTSEVRKVAQRIASEIEEEANARASAIILDAERKAKVEIDMMKAEAERSTQDVIQERIKAATLEGLAIIQLAIEGAEAEARKTIEDAKREVESLQIQMRKPANNEPQSVAKEEKEMVVQRVEWEDGHYEERRQGKGAVRYCWHVEIEGQQHCIEIFLNTTLGVFVRRGQLLVDGGVVRDWGCHPFTIIPQGALAFQVANKTVFVMTRGAITQYPVLVLGNKEIVAVSTRV